MKGKAGVEKKVSLDDKKIEVIYEPLDTNSSRDSVEEMKAKVELKKEAEAKKEAETKKEGEEKKEGEPKKEVEEKKIVAIEKKGGKEDMMNQFLLDHSSSATKLLEKRREMYELQEALQKDKERFLEREIIFKKNEDDLRKRDEDFHNKIKEYYENSYKKKLTDMANYENKMKEEEANKNRLSAEIVEFEKVNSKLKNDLSKLNEIYSSLKKYDDYLREVKERHSDSFNEISDIIRKFDNLTKIHDELKQGEENIRKKMKSEADDFKKTKQMLESEINKKISDTADIQKKIKETKEEKKKLENTVNLFEAKSNSVVSSLEQILLAIENIYDKCKARNDWTKHEIEKKEKKEKKGPRHEYQDRVDKAKDMLKCINNYIEDYQEIIENFTKQHSEQVKENKENLK